MKTLLFKPGKPVSRLRGAGAHVPLPLAVLSLAAYLRDRGHDVGVHDVRIRPVENADMAGVRIVGISCMTGIEVKSGLEIAAHVRKRFPDVVIVWGGIHPSLHGVETARHALVDAVVVGEGEETLHQLVQAVEAGKPVAGIPGTVVCDGENAAVGTVRPPLDLEDLPLPAYDLIDIDDYPNARDMFDYQTSRGCPFQCTFCYNEAFSKRRWRAKSAEKVVGELAHLERTYGVRHFAFVDDEFFIQAKRVHAILQGHEREDLKAQWTASCRIDMAKRLPDETFALMRERGVRRMFFGVESGSPETLAYMKKGITVPMVREVLRRCEQHGVQPVLSFMGGVPKETEEQFQQTLDFISEIRRDFPEAIINGIFPFSPYPGTPMFEDAKAAGLEVPDTLDGWGEWTFEYSPDHPWLSDKMKRDLELAFMLVRFRYLAMRYRSEDQQALWRRAAFEIAAAPLELSERVRWRRRWFRFYPEWKLFRLLMQRTFGHA